MTRYRRGGRRVAGDHDGSAHTASVHITADGLSLTGDVTAEELGLTEADTQLEGALAVGLDLTQVERTICVTGVVEGTAIRECVRCLTHFAEPLAFALRVVYEPEPKAVPPAAKRVDHRKKAVEPVDVEPTRRMTRSIITGAIIWSSRRCCENK